MNLVAVCISKLQERWLIPEIPFYCYTSGYKPILHHDNNDLSRLEYLTDRYNQAVRKALMEYPQSDQIIIVDSYYLRFVPELRALLERYRSLEHSILGGSIWYWDRSHLRAWIRYYDTLSVKEMRNRKWGSERALPSGVLRVSGVGGGFVFPRVIWDRSGGFFVPDSEPQAGGSRCLNTDGYTVLLDCDVKLWRTHADNPGIADHPLIKRARISLGEFRRKLIHR